MTFSQIYYALVLRLAYTCMKNFPIRGLPVLCLQVASKEALEGEEGEEVGGPLLEERVELRGLLEVEGGEVGGVLEERGEVDSKERRGVVEGCRQTSLIRCQKSLLQIRWIHSPPANLPRSSQQLSWFDLA